ncbi:hypothetical protein LCGC14_2005350 [marine sediment metagenome]|uniref:Uncharacterized protein n=1 Tax=marine sediment metagenome TaxID=412755 RepID=A0A0F9F213_9ZZZZ
MVIINLSAKETVVKLANSKRRYLKIPENEFNTITHGDVSKVLSDGTEDHIDIIYRFNKPKVNDPTKGKITKITTNTKKVK